MKKTLRIGATAIALVFFMPTGLLTASIDSSSFVQAQTEVDFEQGTMNEEEYIRSIVEQFNELDTIETVSTSKGEGYESTSTMIMNLKTGVAKIESTIPAVTENSEDTTVVTYLFEDGSKVMDEVAYLESLSDIYLTIDPDFEVKLQQVKDLVGERLVIIPPTEEIKIFEETESQPYFQIDTIEFIEITKELDTVRAVLDTESYFDAIIEGEEYMSAFPEDTLYTITYEVNPSEQTLTSIMTIDIPEEASTDIESDLAGVTVESFLSDSEVKVVSRASNEKIPSLDEIETISKKEFEQILNDVGIENY